MPYKDKDRERAKKREWYLANRHRRKPQPKRTTEMQFCYKIRCLMKKYGSTADRYYNDATTGCAICGSHDRLCIDHDHNTGLYRGVLCWKCNIAIGHLREDGALCLRAANYLGSGMLSPKEITQYE